MTYSWQNLKSNIHIIVSFFIPRHAKLRRLYNSFENFCDIDKFEEMEMETDSLYLTLWEENFYDCLRS